MIDDRKKEIDDKTKECDDKTKMIDDNTKEYDDKTKKSEDKTQGVCSRVCSINCVNGKGRKNVLRVYTINCVKLNFI